MPVQVRWTFWQRVGLCAALVLSGGGATLKAQATGGGQGIAAELQSLAFHASTIFVGQITSIKRKGSVVEVTFRVEQPVAGAAAVSHVVREWAGLWPPEQSRYSVGQRALAFLHASSAAGFSSPVHGAEGLVPVVVQGADAPRLLDLRRVAAAVVRSPNTPLPTEAEGGMLLSDALAMMAPQIRETGSTPVLLPLPTRGGQPRRPGKDDPRYPVILPAQPRPRGPLKGPVSLGGGVELR